MYIVYTHLAQLTILCGLLTKEILSVDDCRSVSESLHSSDRLPPTATESKLTLTFPLLGSGSV